MRRYAFVKIGKDHAASGEYNVVGIPEAATAGALGAMLMSSGAVSKFNVIELLTWRDGCGCIMPTGAMRRHRRCSSSMAARRKRPE